MRGAGPGPASRTARPWCVAAAAALVIVVVSPPLFGLARRYEFVEAIQFSVFALAVPALTTIGLPWARLGLRPRHGDAPVEPAMAERMVSARRPERLLVPAGAGLVPFVVALVLWRTPAAVDGVAGDPWLLVLQALSLLAAGTVLWSVLLDSGPRSERPGRPVRAVVAALAMWSVWIVAYVLGFSHASFYPAFRHSVGHGLAASMDQQLSTGVLWIFAAAAFAPVVFRHVMAWLRAQDDAEAAHYRGAAGTAQ